MAIATNKVQNRRKLHFDTLNDIQNDVECLNQGQIKPLGNWSGGQVLKHLTIVMNGSIDGMGFSSPWWIRLLGRMVKRRILTKGMSAGFQFRGEMAPTLTPPPTSWEDGVQEFRQAIQRLKTEAKRLPSPFLGEMTREEWDQLHCRHAELHLSFLQPEVK
jgi:hypothetical protein